MADPSSKGVEKWTGGLKDLHLDCPVGAVWELCSDWAHWDRFYPSTDFQFRSELKEGENRKPGCLRFAEVAAGMWTNERLLEIDNVNYSFSYNMEENVFCGGLRNYIAKVQFRKSSDGKTRLEHWNYEVDPLTTMTQEAFSAFIEGFLSQKLVRGMEAAAQKTSAAAMPVPKPSHPVETTNGAHHRTHNHGHGHHHHGRHHLGGPNHQ